ncbi:MAG: inorganic phosphate transporter [Marinilabiliaceae bacterium]|nr:inorganic phosphate transporter [Marinilabiliaceae bacterium]
MNSIYLGIVVFLMLLAVVDIVVGVSNDAVNFINSAIGARSAKFKTIIMVSAIGVFAGAALSNGMMDIARHGIFTPQYFSFEDVMCIFLAVMVTDVVLLDIFNTLGMPTSTTVSMVFELLGGAFAISLFKVMDNSELNLGMLLNTDKALQVIVAIFMSVAIAFFFGWLVQWISRCLFSFTFEKDTRIRQGIFSGLSITAIVYFLLINGLKGSTLMTSDLKSFISENTFAIVGCCIVGFSLLMTILSFAKVNVLKIVVLCGTFALAMAFAGNDLVNFIGVPLAGLSSYQDFAANGFGNPSEFMMSSLSESAQTPLVFLMAAGIIMVLSLINSKKAQNVVKTSVDLSRQDEGDEMFGSSRMARTLVRHTLSVSQAISNITPKPVSRFISRRFNVQDAVLTNGAAFDLLRASVNIVIAGLLVALGTSYKLPLSTTYVTFMVAMGTSLADKAWTRESAVFRITGVISVIGGWFITAGIAFFLCLIICTAMHFGSIPIMLAFIVTAIILLIRSNISYTKKRQKIDELEDIFRQIINTKPGDYTEARRLIIMHNRLSNIELVDFVRHEFRTMTDAFFANQYQPLRTIQNQLEEQHKRWKRIRKREIIGMRRIDPKVAIEKNTWFFLANNAAAQMLYCLKRTAEPCAEHLSNNFVPLPEKISEPYLKIRTDVRSLFDRTISMIEKGDYDLGEQIRSDAQKIQSQLSAIRKWQIDVMTTYADGNTMSNAHLVYINILQETQELLSSLRHLIRGLANLSK